MNDVLLTGIPRSGSSMLCVMLSELPEVVALNEGLTLEGFYLPALEAMVLEKLVVCPDAIGNRDFCLADKTCVMPPDHSVDAYFDAVLRAVAMSDEEVREMKSAARAQAEHHRMESEREAYWELFGLADEIWRTESLFRS